MRQTTEQPPSAQIISSPYDAEARYKTKRETSWVGYKVHLTETCDDETPNLITQVTTTPATTDDSRVTAAIQAELAAKALLPAEHYVDRGYTSAAVLVGSQQEYGIHVVGPVQGDAQWQAQTPDGQTMAQFAIDWEAQRVICPAGQASCKWQPYSDGQQQGIVVQFSRRDCQECTLQSLCTRAKTAGRQLTLRPREQHIALQSARRWQESEEFTALYARRAGVEGTFSQGNRRCDLRHARYIGQAKTHLQNLLTAIALNLLRVFAWLEEVPRATTRTSAFAALMGRRLATDPQ